MMSVIYKFPLRVTDEQTINMPTGAKILSVQFQNDQLCVWARIDNEYFKSKRTFLIVGTGHRFPDDGRQYIGTVQQGPFVWHVFEEI